MSDSVALVLEGGGMRGMFTSGVLDVFQEKGFTNFSHIYGVSAGAINGANFKAGQGGKFARDVLAFRDNPEFFGIKSFLKTGDVCGREFNYSKIATELDPINFDAFNRSTVPLTVVTTDVVFGKARYIDLEDMPSQIDAVAASASLPCLSQFVKYDNMLLLDGGIADSIPVERALHDGADKLVVVLTQHKTYKKSQSYELASVADKIYSGYPYLLDLLNSRGVRYNAQRDYIFELEAAGKAVVISPSKPVNLSKMETDGGKLLQLYIDGRRQAESILQQDLSYVSA